MPDNEQFPADRDQSSNLPDKAAEDNTSEYVDDSTRRTDEESSTPHPPSAEGLEDPETMLAKWKANKIERNAIVEYFEKRYDAQLEMVEEELRQAVRVNNAEVVKQADRWIDKINQEHLEFMTELGLRNKEKRQEALQKLGDQTTEALNQIKTRQGEWPPEMLDQTLEAVRELHQRFFQRIMEELGQRDS